MILFIYFLIFMLGASLASFALVIADRYKVKSIIRGRSECSTCSHKLSWYELIPVISFIIQLGRCRNCKSRLSPSHLMGELLGGIILLVIFSITVLGSSVFANKYTPFSIGSAISFIVWLTTLPISIAILIYDLRHKMVPAIPLYVLLTMSSIFALYRYFYLDHNYFNLASGIIVALPYALLFILSRGKWVGLGDVLLYYSFGCLLGLSLGLSMFFVSVWLGAFVTIILLVTHSKEYTLKSEIPFTPFIILAAFYIFIINFDLFGLEYYIN
jgi:leader peptidase (prepilin peptidase) / N-methyltransferase